MSVGKSSHVAALEGFVAAQQRDMLLIALSWIAGESDVVAGERSPHGNFLRLRAIHTRAKSALEAAATMGESDGHF